MAYQESRTLELRIPEAQYSAMSSGGHTRGVLTDREPARRAAAAVLLGRYGNAEQKAAVRKLLADADPTIRVRAAQGLLAGRDKAALFALDMTTRNATLLAADDEADIVQVAMDESRSRSATFEDSTQFVQEMLGHAASLSESQSQHDESASGGCKPAGSFPANAPSDNQMRKNRRAYTHRSPR